MNFIVMRGGVVHLNLKDILWPNSRFISEGGGPIRLDMSWGLIFLTLLLAPYIKMFPTLLKIKGKLIMKIKDNDFIMDLWLNAVNLKDDLIDRFNEFKNNDKKPFIKYLITALLYAFIFYLLFNLEDKNDDVSMDVNKTELNVTIPNEFNATITEVNVSVPTIEKNVTEAFKGIAPTITIVPKKNPPKKHNVKKPVKRNTDNNSIKKECKNCKVKLSPRNNKVLINKLKKQYPKSTIDDIFKEFN